MTEAAALSFSKDERQRITLFGADRELLTANMVIHESLDRMARAVHEYYRQSSPDRRGWEKLTHYEKQSSRALALHIPAKLLSVGMTLDGGGDTRAFRALLEDRGDILLNLARGEHLRWNAHLLTTGWTQLPFTGEYVGKDTAFRRHPCLTGWDGLKAVGQAAGCDFQQYDIHLIQSLGDIVGAAGFGIRLMEQDK